MKTMKNFILLLALTLGFAACEKDEDKIYLSSLEAGELVATESNVVLLQENSKDIVLSLAWTKDVLQISDPGLSAIDVTIQTLQVSTTEDFSGVVNESSENSLSKAYTGAALNALAKSIGATPDVANNVYFRLAARTGNNMIPVYSNIVKVSVTPYTIDMSMGYILNTDKEETGVVLYSDASDGDYKGFMGLTPWYNFYLKEGNGAVWGNDGVTGTAFVLSSEDDDEKRWNCWSPGIGGCYYVDVNVNTKLWSALYIPSLTLAGDLSGEMTFDRPNTKWTYAFNAVQAGNITLQISGTGKLYDSSTGTDDAAAKNTPVAFVQSGESLIFGAQAGNVTVNVPAVGECTLTIDLSNPKQWTVEVSSGSAEPEPEPEPEAPDSPFTTVDASYFDDALFIGDSHTDGFKDYAGLPNADYLCHNGLTVWSAVEKAEFPGKQTLAQALSGKHYGKIYLMLGINELGTGTAESWAAQYKVLLDEVRELQPDAIIFLQAIFHTTQEKSDATFFKNSTIDARNAELQKLADNETVFYIDCNPVFDDSTGALTPEYSGDGVHVKAAYYSMWRDYLFQFGVVK